MKGEVRAIVVGAAGRMGGRIIHMIQETPSMVLHQATERPGHPLLGKDVGEIIGIGKTGILLEGDLKKKGGRGIGRGLLMEMLYRYGGLNQREIGEMMGVDYSSVSVARRPQSHLIRRDRDNLEKIFLGRYFI